MILDPASNFEKNKCKIVNERPELYINIHGKCPSFTTFNTWKIQLVLSRGSKMAV